MQMREKKKTCCCPQALVQVVSCHRHRARLTPQSPPLYFQGELGAQEGEVQGCSAISQGKGVRGVLRVSTPASPATQCHFPPGQSLHHEADHQLSAHEEAAQLWSV